MISKDKFDRVIDSIISKSRRRAMKKVTLFMICMIMCSIVGCNSNKEAMNNNEHVVQNQENGKMGIVEATSFYGGVAIVTVSDGSKFAIDTKGNQLFEVHSTDTDIIFFEETASVENYLINKQGEIIASPDKNHYTGLLTEFVDGYAMAYYYEEGYPHSIIKIGVLNGQGNWHVPLSEGHKILQELGRETAIDIFGSIQREALWFVSDSTNVLSTTFSYGNSARLTYTGTYKGNGIFEIGDLYYSVEQDSIIKDYKGEASVYDNTNDNHTNYRRYTFAGNVVVEADGYTYRHMLNDNGVTYYCVIDAEGRQMFEPRSYIYNDKCICIDEDGFVYRTGNEFILFDLNGKEMCKYENVKELYPFYEGLARVVDMQGMVSFIDKKGNTVIE